MSTLMFMLVPHFALSQLSIFVCHILLNTQEKKCKVFEIILHDLKGNHCEIIAFVYLCMLFGVFTRNITIVKNEEVLCIIGKMQTSDDNASKELGFGKNKGEDEVKGLIVSEIPLLPPPIDNSKSAYVRRKKRFTTLSTTKNQAFKKKGKKTTFSLATTA